MTAPIVFGIWEKCVELPYWLRAAQTNGHTMIPDTTAHPMADRWVCQTCGETASYPGVWGLPAGPLVDPCEQAAA